jgi:hypothetical protein
MLNTQGARIGNLCAGCSRKFARWHEAQREPVQSPAFQRLRKLRG